MFWSVLRVKKLKFGVVETNTLTNPNRPSCWPAHPPPPCLSRQGVCRNSVQYPVLSWIRLRCRPVTRRLLKSVSLPLFVCTRLPCSRDPRLVISLLPLYSSLERSPEPWPGTPSDWPLFPFEILDLPGVSPSEVQSDSHERVCPKAWSSRVLVEH